MPPPACFPRHYLPFAENALRYFFALGFVPWRLRKLSTGDAVPEVIPLGLFTWSIESIPNRTARKGSRHTWDSKDGGRSARFAGPASSRGKVPDGGDRHQVAAERSFQKQKAYFSDPKRVPYPLQGDVMRMQNRSDSTKKAAGERLKGYAEGMRSQQQQQQQPDKGQVQPDSFAGSAASSGDADAASGSDRKRAKTGDGQAENWRTNVFNAAFYRQQEALARQTVPDDDDETKMLRYSISFTENCNVLEDDVEIYEYMPPTNSITRYSLLYGTVPSPLSHILIDYRNIRTTLIRQTYADAYNTQVVLVFVLYRVSRSHTVLILSCSHRQS